MERKWKKNRLCRRLLEKWIDLGLHKTNAKMIRSAYQQLQSINQSINQSCLY